MTGRECDAEIRRQLALGVKPADVWRIFLGYVETLPVADIDTQITELDALAGLFEDEVRGVVAALRHLILWGKPLEKSGEGASRKERDGTRTEPFPL